MKRHAQTLKGSACKEKNILLEYNKELELKPDAEAVRIGDGFF
jgi:hypothetical protein